MVVCALTVTVLGAAVAGVRVGATSYSGNVDAHSDAWNVHPFPVSGPGIVSAAADWSAAAEVNLFLIDPSGRYVAQALGGDRPERLTHVAEPSGTWQLGVEGRTGDAMTRAVTARFTGAGDATTAAWQSHRIEVSGATPLEIVLDWDAGDADLNLFLMDPAGRQVAASLGEDRPEVVRHPGSDGTWTIGVKTVGGASPYRLVVAGATAGGSSPSPQPTPPAASPLRRYAPVFMMSGATFTQSQANDIAGRFELIAAHPQTFRGLVGGMRQVNPDLRIVVYENALFAQSNQGNAYPEDWYVRDAQGRKVRSAAYGNFMMKPRHPAWVADRAQTCREWVTWSGYDGCYLDMLGSGPLFPGYLTSVPINPSTGSPWTHTELVADTAALGRAVRDGNAGRVVTGNGLAAGRRYFATEGSSKPLAVALPHGMTAELFIRLPEEPATTWPTETRWRQEVDMVRAVESGGGSVQALTKMHVSMTAAQRSQWHKFALATFLLGSSGRSTFTFLVDESVDPITTHPWYDAALGSPTGAYYESGNAYRRDFGNGVVVVNPGDTSATVSLGRPYRDVDGQWQSTVSLPPHTAEMLVSG